MCLATYRSLKYIGINLQFFLMTQIGAKFQYIFKLHRSDLRTKVSHHIQNIFFYRALQKFEYINICCSFLMTQIGMLVLKIDIKREVCSVLFLNNYLFI